MSCFRGLKIKPSFLSHMSNGVNIVLKYALLHKINILHLSKCFTFPCDGIIYSNSNFTNRNMSKMAECNVKFGELYIVVIVLFCGSDLMKSVSMFVYCWLCLLFFPIIIIKQSKLSAVVVNNRVIVLRPVSACTDQLAH